MKLLFVLSEYLPESGGGIISYYSGILPYLVAKGHSVDVLVASMRHLDHPDILIDGVRVSYLQSEFLEKSKSGFERFQIGYPTFSAFLPLAWAAYEQVSHGSGYDLVETTDFPLIFTPWVISRDSPPVIVSLHGSCGQLDWYEHPERNSMDGDMLRLMERVALACAPSVYTNSLTNSRFWEGATKRKIDILPPHQPQIPHLDFHEGMRSTDGVVVGRFQNWKGSRVLARAIRELPDERVRWIGSDVIDSYTHLPHSASIHSEFPGVIGSQILLEGSKSREDVLQEVVGATYLCIPSEWDVFNLTAVEAMTLGTPVICSKAAGASMLINHGENGFLFDPGKPEDLAACIRTVRALSEVDRNNIISHARETIKVRLGSEQLLQLRIAWYQEVMSCCADWGKDAWLSDTVSPREESSVRLDNLKAYTVKELAKATVGQISRGLLRKTSNQ